MSIHIPSILLSIPRNPVTAVGLPISFGFLSGTSATKVANSNWVFNLKSPPGTPPREAFPLIWAALYFSMGCASHIAVISLDTVGSPTDRENLRLGIALYYGQLALNCLWKPIFFGWHSPGYALLDSGFVTTTTWYMTKLLHKPTDGKTTYFLLPYCAWMAYATYLNAGLWWLNRKENSK